MKADVRDHNESRFHPKVFEDLKGIALGALFLSPLVAAGFGFTYGQNQEQANNQEAQTQVERLQRCEEALGLMAGKTVLVSLISYDIDKACQIPKHQTSTTPKLDPGAATISEEKYFVDMPTTQTLQQEQTAYQRDANDNNQLVPLGYAGVFFGITAGYVTMLTVSRERMQ